MKKQETIEKLFKEKYLPMKNANWLFIDNRIVRMPHIVQIYYDKSINKIALDLSDQNSIYLSLQGIIDKENKEYGIKVIINFLLKFFTKTKKSNGLNLDIN